MPQALGVELFGVVGAIVNVTHMEVPHHCVPTRAPATMQGFSHRQAEFVAPALVRNNVEFALCLVLDTMRLCEGCKNTNRLALVEIVADLKQEIAYGKGCSSALQSNVHTIKIATSFFKHLESPRHLSYLEKPNILTLIMKHIHLLTPDSNNIC